jgi:hypothetical protein
MGFNDIATAHIMGPVFTFHEDIGENLGNEVSGFVLVENDDEIHGAKGTEDECAILLGIDGSRGAFGSADGGVAVETYDECVALCPCESEIVRVAPVEDVEASVGEDEFFTLSVESVAFLTGLPRV